MDIKIGPNRNGLDKDKTKGINPPYPRSGQFMDMTRSSNIIGLDIDKTRCRTSDLGIVRNRSVLQ
jgi:hypothetical protein